MNTEKIINVKQREYSEGTRQGPKWLTMNVINSAVLCVIKRYKTIGSVLREIIVQ